jgi:choice-of-anchor C domain-containing protein
VKRSSIVSAALAFVASISMAGSAFAFSGVSNGSFEAGTFTANPFDTLPAGSTAITDWTVDSGSIDWIGSYWQAADGSRSIDLNGNETGAISQTLTTTIGNTYVVTFDLSGNTDCPPTAKTLTVGATGAPPASYTFDTAVVGNSRVDMKWVAQTYTFLATNSSSVLAFTSTTAGPCGPALDNVSVTENVPTANDCKKGGWHSLIDAFGNGFKNQGDCVSYFATGGKNLGSVAPLTVAAPAPVATAGDTSGSSVADVKRSAHPHPRTDANGAKVHENHRATNVRAHAAKGNH